MLARGDADMKQHLQNIGNLKSLECLLTINDLPFNKVFSIPEVTVIVMKNCHQDWTASTCR